MALPKLQVKGNLKSREIILSVLAGIYFYLVYVFHVPLINLLLNGFGLYFQNNHEILTLFGLLFLASFAAGLHLNKTNKPASYSFDKTLLVGFISGFTFLLGFNVLIFFFRRAFSLPGFIGVLFFSILFSFIIAALNATLLGKLFSSQNSK